MLLGIVTLWGSGPAALMLVPGRFINLTRRAYLGPLQKLAGL